MYESPDLGVSGGWQVSLREGEYGLAELRAAGAVDEQLSSISVFHVPPGPWRMGKRQRSLCPTEACLGLIHGVVCLADPTSFMTFLTVRQPPNPTPVFPSPCDHKMLSFFRSTTARI